MSFVNRISGAAVMLASLSAFTAAPSAHAADVSDLTIDQQIEMVRSLNEAARQATIAANLEISRDVGDAFWPIYRSYRGEAGGLNDSLKTLILQYADSYADLTDEAAFQLSEKALKLQIQRDKLKQKYLKRFSKALSRRDAARVMQIENKLDALMQAELAVGVPLIQAR